MTMWSEQAFYTEIHGDAHLEIRIKIFHSDSLGHSSKQTEVNSIILFSLTNSTDYVTIYRHTSIYY